MEVIFLVFCDKNLCWLYFLIQAFLFIYFFFNFLKAHGLLRWGGRECEKAAFMGDGHTAVPAPFLLSGF